MDKPKCRVCGERHWGSEPHAFAVNLTENPPHVFGDDVNLTAAPVRVRKPNAGCARCVELEAEITALRAKLEGRRTYQREYMRRRRSP